MRVGLRALKALLGVWRALAWLGWRLGVRGAGRRYAKADDQWRMLRGRLPRYAVASYDHGVGELEVPILAGTVGDAELRALGLPTRGEQRRAVEAENRRRAEVRHQQVGLRDGLNLARVWHPVSATDLESRWQAEGAQVWRDGDDLTFVHRAEASEVRVLPGIQLPMWRVEADLWVLMVRVRDLDRAAISFSFTSPGEPWPQIQTWRGPLAPPAPRRAATLTGEVAEAAIESRSLGESRGITTYVPPGVGARHTSPSSPFVVFMTDGQGVRKFAEVVEPLVLDDALPRTVLVGVHCAESGFGGEARNQEYIPGFDRGRFEAHRRFFMEEVPAWAERELGVSGQRTQCAVAGCSSGAVLVSTLGCLYPDRIGKVIAFSPGVQPPLSRGLRPAPHYLLAGTLEPAFLENTRRLADGLRRNGAEVELRERVCGHDPLMWEEELPRAIAWGFAS